MLDSALSGTRGPFLGSNTFHPRGIAAFQGSNPDSGLFLPLHYPQADGTDGVMGGVAASSSTSSSHAPLRMSMPMQSNLAVLPMSQSMPMPMTMASASDFANSFSSTSVPNMLNGSALFLGSHGSGTTSSTSSMSRSGVDSALIGNTTRQNALSMLLSSGAGAASSPVLFYRSYDIQKALKAIKNDPNQAPSVMAEVLKHWQNICLMIQQQATWCIVQNPLPDLTFCREYEIKSKLQQILNNPHDADGVIAEVVMCWQGVVNWLRIPTPSLPLPRASTTALSMLRASGAASNFGSFPQRFMTLPLPVGASASASASIASKISVLNGTNRAKRKRGDDDDDDGDETKLDVVKDNSPLKKKAKIRTGGKHRNRPRESKSPKTKPIRKRRNAIDDVEDPYEEDEDEEEDDDDDDDDDDADDDDEIADDIDEMNADEDDVVSVKPRKSSTTRKSHVEPVSRKPRAELVVAALAASRKAIDSSSHELGGITISAVRQVRSMPKIPEWAQPVPRRLTHYPTHLLFICAKKCASGKQENKLIFFEVTVGAVMAKQDGEEKTPYVIRLDKNGEHVGVRRFVGPLMPPTLLRAWDLEKNKKNNFKEIKPDVFEAITYLRTPTAEKKVYKITITVEFERGVLANFDEMQGPGVNMLSNIGAFPHVPVRTPVNALAGHETKKRVKLEPIDDPESGVSDIASSSPPTRTPSAKTKSKSRSKTSSSSSSSSTKRKLRSGRRVAP